MLMMKVILFLGSGVSLKTLGERGDIEKITAAIFHENYISKEEMCADEPWPHVRRFLKMLYDYNEEFVDRRLYPDEHRTNYEHLYHLCSQISLTLLKYGENAAVWEFVKMIRRNTATLIQEASRSSGITYELVDFAGMGAELIESIVQKSLSAKGRIIEGFGLLQQIVKSSTLEEVCIVTLNHDDLIERVLRSEHITFTDGFDEPDGQIRWYNPENTYSPKHRISLIKLHGSITWRHESRGRRRVGNPICENLDQCFDSNNRRVDFDTLPLILTGGEKEIIYHSGIFGDMFGVFLRTLNSMSIMIMSGYGWRDIGINLRLKTWLDRDPKRRIILLYENPDDIRIRFELGGNIGNSYDELNRRAQLAIFPKWFSDTSLSEIESLLNGS